MCTSSIQPKLNYVKEDDNLKELIRTDKRYLNEQRSLIIRVEIIT
jgi:hypothetical protein